MTLSSHVWMHLAAKAVLGLFSFLTAITLIRLFVAPAVGLGVDEAHYVLYGYYLDLSYFDHPPLIGWIEYLFTSIFGLNTLGARIPAIILGVLTSYALFHLLLHVNKNRSLALFGVMALNASFMFNALFLMLMPETLLFALSIPIIFTVIAIEHNNRLRDWLTLGLLLGLAGLSKYTAVLFVVAIVLYLMMKRHLHLIFKPGVIPAIIVALVMISPVIFWNMQHEWISFAFQSDHVTGSSHINFNKFGQSIAAQFGAYSPFLFPVAYYGLYKSLTSKNDYLLLSGIMAAVIVLFFGYASLYNKALPHWNALFFMLMIPIGSVYMYQASQRMRRYIIFAVIASLIISLALYLELLFKFNPFPDYRSLHRDLYGFDRIMREANARLKQTEALAVANWSLGSRALYYNLPFKSNLFVIDRRKDQFDLWQKNDPIGEDLLFISTHDFNAKVAKNMKCDSIEARGSVDIMLQGRKVNTAVYTLCHHFQGLK